MTVSDEQARGRVLLGLDGLVPLVWMEALHKAGYRGDGTPRNGLSSNKSDLLPTDGEREVLVAALVVADDLALGVGRGKGSLAALARAIVGLAAVPGGVAFLGCRWKVVEVGDRLELKDGAA